jgi:hypothetical protein
MEWDVVVKEVLGELPISTAQVSDDAGGGEVEAQQLPHVALLERLVLVLVEGQVWPPCLILTDMAALRRGPGPEFWAWAWRSG